MSFFDSFWFKWNCPTFTRWVHTFRSWRRWKQELRTLRKTQAAEETLLRKKWKDGK